jgi:DNA modification methylase
MVQAPQFNSLNAKRAPISTGGIEAWYPYYAGYSNIFAEHVIEGLGLKNGQILLDPWNGSGTTTYVGDCFGLNSIGVDINPVAVLVASAKLVRMADAIHSKGLVEQIIKIAQDRCKAKLYAPDPLDPWLNKTAIVFFRALQESIILLLAKNRTGVKVKLTEGMMPPLAAFLMLSLVRAARSLVVPKKTSNPTWVRPEESKGVHKSKLINAFIHYSDFLSRELETKKYKDRSTESKIMLGDARNLTFIEDNSIDAVLTSPPYCTRIDYAISTCFELAALGISETDESFRALRKNLTGTTLIRNSSSRECFSIPLVSTLLNKIEKHPSKASGGYYLKGYIQYFEDILLALKEIRRVLRPGSQAVLVVQNSYYKEIKVDLAKLILAIGKSISFPGELVGNFPVHRVMGTINPASSCYLQNKKYSESVLILEKMK